MKKFFASFFKSRKFKYGSVSTALTIVFIAVVVIINIIFSMLTSLYSWKMDLTANAMYSITEQSKSIAQNLTEGKNVQFIALSAEEDYPDPFATILKRYANLSKNIKLTFVDPIKNPEAMDFGEEFDVQESAIVVQCGERTRVINPEAMYQVDDTTGEIISVTLEEELSSAVIYVTKDEIPLVYFITGHEESGYDSLMNLMDKNGNDVKEIRIDQIKKEDNAKTIVICAPQKDYSEQDIKALHEFLQGDYAYERNLFYFASPGAGKLTNLETYLKDTWEIQVNHDLVLETEENSVNNYSEPEMVPLFVRPSYNAEAEVNGETILPSTDCVVPYSSSLQIVDSPKSAIESVALLTTSKGSYAKETAEGVKNFSKAAGDAEGPFAVAAISTKQTYTNNISTASHVFVAGSAHMLGETYMKNNANSEYLLKIYQMMVGETDVEVAGTVKSMIDESMTLDQKTSQNAYVIFIGVIPAVFLLVGAVVFIRRRFL